ncbi:DUF1214 domain-containing protein [Seohaeicola saemankumensis]|nr:DUF1214 domain-containing protein [Seohaeicola saemankumensis]MCA0871313.1 DUF1214 domain-containing protein [Seohaeicola saemankumensis]
MSAPTETRHVDVTTFVRAETDSYMARRVAMGALGQFVHARAPVRIDKQDVIRMNRDTLISAAIFDLRQPVTIRMPETGGRFQSLQAISQDHYVVGLEHEAGSYRFSEESVGTRYLAVIVRTFLDPNDPGDLVAAHAAQDAIAVEQADPGCFEVPSWDTEALAQTRKLLLGLAMGYRGAITRAFGAKDEVDPVRHLVATAAGWGGNPERAAIYVERRVAQNDGTVPHVLTLRDVPVDGFWSVTVYNERGFMEPNPADVCSVNNVTAARNADGSVTVQFGGCAGGQANCIPTPANWSYNIRLYRPRAEVLDGSWRCPEAQPLRGT